MAPGMPHLFVCGYGYSARRIGERILERGWRVSGTRTSPEGAVELESLGVELHVFDGRKPVPEVSDVLRSATHVLVTAAPGEDGDPLLLQHEADVSGAGSLAWIGYLSTTGVYGDHGGGVVDESTRVAPGTTRSRRRVEAERAWRELASQNGATLQIFRLSGIYGPGRSVLDRLRDGSARRIVAPDLVFNRIHVEDVAGAVAAGIDRPHQTGVFNVSDDLPAPPSEVVAYGAELLGVESPPELPLEEASLSAAARSFYEENKRVDNRRLASGLEYRLRYPTYREGLAAVRVHEARQS